MRYLAASAAILGLAASSASAAITAFWTPVNITATSDSVTPAPGISGFQSWDLMVNLTAGDDFTSFRLLFDPESPIFQHALGNNDPASFGPPNAALFPSFPALEFDSYLRSPSGGGVTVLGSTDGTNDLPPPGIFDSNRLAVAAGDLSTNPGPGDFQIARITFGPGPLPTIEAGTLLGRVFSLQTPGGFQIPNIPEPTALGFIGASALLMVRRRKA